MKQAVIFDIQRFSIHDGPGIRTTVFFKWDGGNFFLDKLILFTYNCLSFINYLPIKEAKVVQGIIWIVVGIGIIIFNTLSKTSKLVIRGTGIDFGYLAIVIGVVVIIMALVKKKGKAWYKKFLIKFIKKTKGNGLL